MNTSADLGRPAKPAREAGTHLDLFIGVCLILVAAFSVWGIFFPESLESTANSAMVFLKANFSWLYLWAGFGFVVFALVIAFSRWGKIRLGEDDERPRMKTVTWFAMLFAAGMGVGLVFWGVAEPLSHYVSPMAGIEAVSEESEAFSFRSTFMHWGLHPWGLYAVVGLGLAYTMFRRKKKALVSCIIKPVLGRQEHKAIGQAIDCFTVVLTVIGVATSFGMGTLQIAGGLEAVLGIPDTMATWIIIIAIVGVVYLGSAISGIERGMSMLSNANLVICVAFLVLAFLVGQKADILMNMGQGVIDYIVYFIPDSLRLSSNGDSTWINAWRVYYWAWWLSWAPFVGIFIARISRGRTIREFIIAVMIAPTLVGVIWFGIFGTLGIDAASLFSIDQLSEIIASPETALYNVFAQYPLGTVLSVLAMVLLFTFFVTSANSATYVLAMLTSKGNENPPTKIKVIWGILTAFVALALILSGGVSGIQTIAIVIAFPFFIVMILICVSLVKMLHGDSKKHLGESRAAPAEDGVTSLEEEAASMEEKAATAEEGSAGAASAKTQPQT